MEPVAQHPLPPDVQFDGGDLDCGNGLLLLIRQHIDPLPCGGLLEFRSTEISVEADFPAWCRMTERVLLTPDCGFATFADNAVASARIAEEKLRAIARADDILRTG